LAHNTVTIDGTDQTEVWGSFRAGRRAKATVDEARIDGDGLDIRAHHTGYQYLPGAPVHERSWTISPDQIRIVDHIHGAKVHAVCARLLIDAAEVLSSSNHKVECRNCLITVQGPDPDDRPPLHLRETSYAIGHGKRKDGLAIVVKWRFLLPGQLVTTIDLKPQQTPSESGNVNRPGQCAG
jgi:hypothetical protein